VIEFFVLIIAQALFYPVVATERSVQNGEAMLRNNGAQRTPGLAILVVLLWKILLITQEAT
jgi:hypothetical protein